MPVIRCDRCGHSGYVLHSACPACGAPARPVRRRRTSWLGRGQAPAVTDVEGSVRGHLYGHASGAVAGMGPMSSRQTKPETANLSHT